MHGFECSDFIQITFTTIQKNIYFALKVRRSGPLFHLSHSAFLYFLVVISCGAVQRKIPFGRNILRECTAVIFSSFLLLLLYNLKYFQDFVQSCFRVFLLSVSSSRQIRSGAVLKASTPNLLASSNSFELLLGAELYF